MINIISAYLVICFTYVLYTQKHDEKIEKKMVYVLTDLEEVEEVDIFHHM
jgi:hypothetical protein